MRAVASTDELWKRVGEELMLVRSRKQWDVIDVQKHGGPTYKTVQAIERGEVGQVRPLAQHAEALGLSLVDVLRQVLCPDTHTSPEAIQIMRVYDTTTVKGRQALLTLAAALETDAV